GGDCEFLQPLSMIEDLAAKVGVDILAIQAELVLELQNLTDRSRDRPAVLADMRPNVSAISRYPLGVKHGHAELSKQRDQGPQAVGAQVLMINRVVLRLEEHVHEIVVL